jgi:hypothetical protein
MDPTPVANSEGVTAAAVEFTLLLLLLLITLLLLLLFAMLPAQCAPVRQPRESHPYCRL